ncbi:MAG: hypothetical protein RJQ10_00545 [Haliea sp.]|uniref:hypothetical protein n=1 Tax=Haliea sp. TaxID=1932666 RepID=UPI0032EEBFBF
MNTSRIPGLALAGLLLFSGLAVAGPPLSAEVARWIDSQGVDAARERFAELWASAADDYEPDLDALADLGSRYLQEGNIEAGMAVMEMVSIISLAELDAALQSQAALVAEMEAAAAEIAATTGAPASAQDGSAGQQAEATDRGPARADLERFAGIYASDEQPDRQLFVTRTCDGFLVAGPMWADVAAWQLGSEGKQVFTFEQGELFFQLAFSGGEGMPQILNHNIRGLASPLRHRGPLPGDWPRCQPAADPPR